MVLVAQDVDFAAVLPIKAVLFVLELTAVQTSRVALLDATVFEHGVQLCCIEDMFGCVENFAAPEGRCFI